MPSFAPLLSIAICTYNRAWLLKDALSALAEQTASSATFEVLVVDNGSEDETADVARDFSTRFAHFLYVHEPLLGLSFARNTALKRASADWVCYLDDDALADANYVDVALRECAAGHFICFGGKIRPWRRDPLPDWFLDEYEIFEGPETERTSPMPPASYIFGGNMVVNRQAVLDLGGFNTNYGVSGNTFAYGEETELQARIVAMGKTIGFVPDLIILHYARPEKYTIPRRMEIQYKAGNAWQRILNDSSFTGLCGIVGKFFASPAKGVWVSAGKLAKRTYRWQNVLVNIGGRLFFCAGRLSAWIGLRREKIFIHKG